MQKNANVSQRLFNLGKAAYITKPRAKPVLFQCSSYELLKQAIIATTPRIPQLIIKRFIESR